MDVPVQPRVVHEDLQAAADEQDQEQEVDVVRDAQPGREAVRRGGLGDHCGTGRHWRQAEYRPLQIGCGDRESIKRISSRRAVRTNSHDHYSMEKYLISSPLRLRNCTDEDAMQPIPPPALYPCRTPPVIADLGRARQALAQSSRALA